MQLGEMPLFPRRRESRFLKLFKFITDWMPAFTGMMNYDTVSRGRGAGAGNLRVSGWKLNKND
jgi:hypothetical protein